MADFLKTEMLFSHYIRTIFFPFYCLNFVYEPSSLIKSFNKIYMIEIILQTRHVVVKIGKHRTGRRKNTINVKNCLYFFLLP